MLIASISNQCISAPNGAGTPTNPGAYPGPVPGGDDSVALVSVFPPPGTVLQQPGTAVVFEAAMRYKLSSAPSERSRSRCAHPGTVQPRGFRLPGAR